MSKLSTAFRLFDDYNRQDPNTLVWDGREFPTEYFYAQQLYNWVTKLTETASETLLLASRCQHIGRWKIPRDQYPRGKAGYLRWRTDLAKFHASEAEQLLNDAGYNDAEIARVQRILLKQNLKIDEDVQVMEDALCLVFLEFQFEAFIQKHDDDKLIRIVQKSWKKMSEKGRNVALLLNYSPRAKLLLDKALN
ncbi:MAG TPA: DUF4202 domain-containing protein [Flavitalea sp.]|nr:DUF4202 domain-containing protein [Flavitalea sp.]